MTHVWLISPLFTHTFTQTKPLSSHPDAHVRFQKTNVAPLGAPKATRAPLRATESHSYSWPRARHSTQRASFFFFQIPCSRVTGFWHLNVRGCQGSGTCTFAGDRGLALPCSRWLCSRSFLVVRLPWSIVPFSRASTAPNKHRTENTNKGGSKRPHSHIAFAAADTHHGLQKSRTHPSRHGHCPVDSARSCGAVLLIVLRCYGQFREQEQ